MADGGSQAGNLALVFGFLASFDFGTRLRICFFLVLLLTEHTIRYLKTRETNINSNVYDNIHHKDAGIYTVQTMRSSNSSNEENVRNKKYITHLIFQKNQS